MNALRNAFCLLIGLAIIFSLTACGSSSSSPSPTPVQETREPAELPDAVLTPAEPDAQEETSESVVDRAKAYIDRPLSELEEEFGEPVSASYVTSCLGPGQDGELVFAGFTVITYQEGESETVTYVEAAS